MALFSRSLGATTPRVRNDSGERRRPALASIDMNAAAPTGVVKHQRLATRSLSARSLRGTDRDGTLEGGTTNLTETSALVENQASVMAEQADAAVEALGAYLNDNQEVNLQGFVTKLVPDTERVREFFKSAPAKKMAASPANMTKLFESNKAFKVLLKEIMQQKNTLVEATVKVETAINGHLREHQERMAQQQREHEEAQQRSAREALAAQEAFDQKLAEAVREQNEISAAADRREAELTEMVEARERDIVQARTGAEALRRQIANLQEELNGCLTSLKAKTELADETAREKDLLQARYDTLREQHGATENQQMHAIAELKVMVGRLETTVESQKLEVKTKEINEADQEKQILALRRQLLEEERQRREMHNSMQELKGNIRVVGRSRPPFEEEAALALRVSEGTGKMSVTHGEETYTFELGNVFGGMSTQERMYDEVSGLVQSALDGYKVCIFAYGQTGSGKTFTMQGSRGANNEGIIPRALTQIFNSTEAMQAKGWLWTLEASFLEVYQEQFRDLLLEGSAAESQPIHAILQDEARGPSVSNLTVVNVDSIAQIQRLMAKAAKHRTVGQTDMNAVSSRSHAIFALYLRGSNAELDTELTGALHLVDLAGSERLSKSNATGSRMKETCNINKSLSCLTDVFVAKQEEARGERSHIPFRNSKLTHLMEPCLSGHGKTLMVLNVAPEETHAHETLCSLRFASNVAQCNTGGQPKRSAKTMSDTAPAPRPATPTNRAGSRPATPTNSSRPAIASSTAGGKAASKGRQTNPFGL